VKAQTDEIDLWTVPITPRLIGNCFSQAHFEALFSMSSTAIFWHFSLRGVKNVRKVASGGQDREQGVCGLKTKTLQGIEPSAGSAEG